MTRRLVGTADSQCIVWFDGTMLMRIIIDGLTYDNAHEESSEAWIGRLQTHSLHQSDVIDVAHLDANNCVSRRIVPRAEHMERVYAAIRRVTKTKAGERRAKFRVDLRKRKNRWEHAEWQRERAKRIRETMGSFAPYL